MERGASVMNTMSSSKNPASAIKQYWWRPPMFSEVATERTFCDWSDEMTLTSAKFLWSAQFVVQSASAGLDTVLLRDSDVLYVIVVRASFLTASHSIRTAFYSTMSASHFSEIASHFSLP
jgi:hypothetical protein